MESAAASEHESLKTFGRMLLSLACAAILQTAVVAADVEAGIACIDSAGLSGDKNDCSGQDQRNNNVRHQVSAAPPDHRSPKPKGFAETSSAVLPAAAQSVETQSPPAATDFGVEPVYLLTLRLRI